MKFEEHGLETIVIGNVEQEIDIAEAYNAMVELSAKHAGQPTPYLEAIREWLKGKGYPACSLWTVESFARHITKRREELAANFSRPPGLPGSTDPKSGGCPTSNG